MRLVECAAPDSALSFAPLTALRDSQSVTVPIVSRTPDGGDVAGFWGLDDDAYYVRERSPAGEVWFRLVDDEPATQAASTVPISPLREVARGTAVMRVTRGPDGTAGRPTIIGAYPAKSRAS